MRVAPLGALLARHPEELSSQVRLASEFTHAHPVGIDGALAQAAAVATAVRTGKFGPPELADLVSVVTTHALSDGLHNAVALSESAALPDPNEVAQVLGDDVTADRSVPTALYLAASSEHLLDGITRALEVGGDVDTIAAMTGAVLGAVTGLSRFPKPKPVVDLLEDGEQGRTYAIRVAVALAARAEANSGEDTQ